MNFWEWIKANLPYIGSIGLGVVIIASIVVKWTPSTKDNGFIAKLVGFLDKISICQSQRNKKLLEIAEEIIADEKVEELEKEKEEG